MSTKDSLLQRPRPSLRAAVVALEAHGQQPHHIAAHRKRRAAVAGAIKRAADQGVSLLLFPGYTTAHADLGKVEDARIVRDLASAAISGFFEVLSSSGAEHHKNKKGAFGTRAFFLFDAAMSRLLGPFHQVVATAAEANTAGGRTRLRQLAADLSQGGSRRFTIGQHDVSLLICGEDNILYQARNGPLGSRWDNTTWADHDLLFNPRHSISARWEVERRLEFLSSSRRNQVAASCTNYEADGEWYRRTVHLCRGGHTVVRGDDPALTRGNGFVLGHFKLQAAARAGGD